MNDEVKLVQPTTTIVVLDKVEPGSEPDYCVHGKVSCYFCDDWCWLGDETYNLVSEGKATGVCIQCATEVIPRSQEPVGHIEDHRRADGPHQ